ncbi:MAG: hypothetical protein KJ844_08945 [Candidatus Edwardsbacteria bacterium]|nr:hypothetical protein [Candidatus Edwardsbacteria bacterium]
MKHLTKIYLVILTASIAALNAYAFDSFDPRTMAQAGATVVRSRGVEGSLANPANLGLENNGGLNIKLFHFGAMAGNNSFNLNDYNRAAGDFLDDGEKDALLRAIPSSGFRASSSLDAMLLGLAAGRMALTVNLRSAESVCIPRDVFDLALFGNELDRTYSLAASDMGDAWTVAATTLSYGQPIKVGVFKRLSLGIGIKHLMGINYGKVGGEINFTTSGSGFNNIGLIEILSAGENDFDTKKLNMNGSGFAADLGLACQLNDHWSLGASLMNLSNGITWKNDTRKRTLNMDVSELTLLGDSITGMFSGNEVIDRTDTLGGIFRSRYPAAFNAGIAYESKYFSAELDVKKGFHNGAGSAARWQLAQGFEVRLLSFLPSRAGLAVLDNRTIAYSAGGGLKLGFVRLDAAATSLGFPGYNSKGFGASVSAGMEFGR